MGEVFAGRYELADPIGRGGVGAVWRAWDHRRRRYVAAKVLQQRDAHSLLRFVREQALRIDHPHVLAPASWAADDDKVLFTMDLVAGGSLVHLVGDYGPLPPALVTTLLDQLLSGLAAVHAEGVVHRDIKPANLLLEATGTARPRLRLSDFGIAMRLGEPRLTETNLVVGTPGYLAPEQLLGEEPDFPADLFAVGLVALYLLEGAKPDAAALVDHFTAHGTPGAPRGVPEPLWQIVATLLQPDPHARFRTATGARKALASVAELLPEQAPDDETIEIFDQLGPLPPGFGPEGPLRRPPGPKDAPGTDSPVPSRDPAASPPSPPHRPDGAGTGSAPRDPRRADSPPSSARPVSMSDTGSFHLPPPPPAAPPQGLSPPPSPPQPPDVVPSGTGTPRTPPAPGAPDRTPSNAPPPPWPPHPGTHLPPDAAPDTASHPPVPGSPPRPRPAPAVPQPVPPASTARPPAPYGPARSPFASRPLQPPPPSSPLQPQSDAATASYTARDAQVPAAARTAPSASPTPRADGRRRRRRRQRPGPPPAVTVPVLLLALVCYVVGFWALAHI